MQEVYLICFYFKENTRFHFNKERWGSDFCLHLCYLRSLLSFAALVTTLRLLSSLLCPELSCVLWRRFLIGMFLSIVLFLSLRGVCVLTWVTTSQRCMYEQVTQPMFFPFLLDFFNYFIETLLESSMTNNDMDQIARHFFEFRQILLSDLLFKILSVGSCSFLKALSFLKVFSLVISRVCLWCWQISSGFPVVITKIKCMGMVCLFGG